MAITKNLDEIKINSGNNFQIRAEAENNYETLGNIESGMLSLTGSTVEGQFANGFKWKKRGASEGSLRVVLSQVSAEIVNRILQLLNQTIEIYFLNGIDDKAEAMEIYAKYGTIVEQIALDMKGNTPQVIALDIVLNPESEGVMSVTPDTDLPADAYAEGAEPVAGYSPFCVILGTDTTPAP